MEKVLEGLVKNMGIISKISLKILTEMLA